MKEKEKQNRFLLLSKLAALEQMENNLFLLTNRQKQLEDFVAAERALLTSGNEHAATISESPVVSKSGKRNYVKALEKVKVDLSKLQLRIVQANASIAVMKSKLEMNKSSIQLNEERLQAVQEAIRAKEDALQCKMEAKQKALKAKKDKEEEKRPQSQKLLSNTSRTVVFGNGADEREQAAEKPSPFELLRTEDVPKTISSNNSAEEQLINAIDGSADHLYYCQLYDASVQLKNTLPHVQDILCKSSYEQVLSPACQFCVIKLASLNEKCYAFSVIDTGDDELIYTDELYNAETLTELLTDKEEKSDESDDAYNSLSNYYTNDLLPATDTSGCNKPIGLQLIGICFDLEHSCHDHPMYDMLMNMQAERVEVPEVQAKVEVQKKLSVPKESISAILNEQTAKKSIQTLQAFGFEATSSHTIPNERKRPLS
ncbi:hypothetical protein TTRE_0000535101 [Trichuris trichiura]|uniref:Uncharacterized protein n=1 Tax=Trichuris trichiura TaxID=36087 RepID=A0A077ZA02_TRITR|nr:hypothetical protein TTRE_0000535101 [Trichuris trichiura]